MLMICVTHADAQPVEPRYIFRGLSKKGREDVKHAAQRFRERIPETYPQLAEKKITIEKIVSSPMARCVETVLLFAKEINDFTKTSELNLNDRLKEKRGKDNVLTANDLLAVIDANQSHSVILLGTHGDLASALPKSATRCIENQNGWFVPRPVMVIIDYEIGTPWENAKVLYCEGYHLDWLNLLENK